MKREKTFLCVFLYFLAVGGREKEEGFFDFRRDFSVSDNILLGFDNIFLESNNNLTERIGVKTETF